MATTQTLYRSPDGIAAMVGDRVRLSVGGEWTVTEILEVAQNGDQLLHLEIDDEDLLACSW